MAYVIFKFSTKRAWLDKPGRWVSVDATESDLGASVFDTFEKAQALIDRKPKLLGEPQSRNEIAILKVTSVLNDLGIDWRSVAAITPEPAGVPRPASGMDFDLAPVLF